MPQFAMAASSLKLFPVVAETSFSTQEIVTKERARELERLTKNGRSGGLPEEDMGYHLMFFMLLLGVIFLLRKTLAP